MLASALRPLRVRAVDPSFFESTPREIEAKTQTQLGGARPSSVQFNPVGRLTGTPGTHRLHLYVQYTLLLRVNESEVLTGARARREGKQEDGRRTADWPGKRFLRTFIYLSARSEFDSDMCAYTTQISAFVTDSEFVTTLYIWSFHI